MSAFGEPPDVTPSVPVIDVRLPESLLRPLEEFSRAVPVFAQATEDMLAAVKKLKEKKWGLRNRVCLVSHLGCIRS